MDNKVEELYQLIGARKNRWMLYRNVMGENHEITNSTFNHIMGLEEAFEMLCGHSYTEHLLADIKAKYPVHTAELPTINH